MSGGAPGSEGRPSEVSSGGGGVHLLRDLPIDQSILWHPTSPTIVQRKPPSGPYPVFIEQKAIAAVNAHYETAGRQGMMGFLVGDLFESPENHQRYVVVDQTIRLNQAVYGDKTLVIVSRLWDRIQEELKKTEGHLIGWYHSHPPITVELAPGDVETHLQYFKRPWHVALVLGSEHEGPVAGLFRPKPGETSLSLPFYELIDEAEEGVALTSKQSVLPWINYLTDDRTAKHADGSTPLAVTPPPSASALQFVKATPTPTPRPVPGIASAVRPAPAAPAPKPPPPPTPAVPLKPAAPLAPAASANPRPPAAVVSSTGTISRPALGDRPQATQPPQPPPPPSPPAASPPLRRDMQMKSPHNALSDLPIVEAGGYHLGDVDARASEPGVVRPRTRDAQHVPAVPPPRPAGSPLGRPEGSPVGRPVGSPVGRRPTITPKPFAPALAPRSDGHPGLVAFFVMALIAGGGFAGWKYWWLPNHPAQDAAAAPAATAPASPATPDTAKRSGSSSLATGHQPPATAVPPPATAVASDSPLVALDRNADSVASLTDIYKARVQANQTGCPGLGLALVAVEDAWTRYNVGKRKAGSLDGTRFLRDQQLYASVDTVERDFDRSGCTRP
jgi:proteasome lid subunit RPN8/RPN11